MTETAPSPADSGGLLSLMLPSLCFPENEANGLGYYGDQNLFCRIIRNPNPYGRMPKERECAEMLCACLIHLPRFRTALLSKMAEWVQQPLDFDNLRLEFSTEQPIWGKRDDLRVEGFNAEGVQQLLWTIEIKVGSGFHYSTRAIAREEADEQGEEDEKLLEEIREEMVNQLENYDDWLTEQTHVSHRAGFIISIHDLKNHLPEKWEQKNPWHCLTWRDVAVEWRHLLQMPVLSEKESFLGKHMLGFIEQSLGGGEMENNLQLEDIAFFKAFAHQGVVVKQKIRELLYAAFKKLEYSSLFSYEPKFESQIYQNLHRQTFYWSLIDSSNKEPPFLCAGFVSERRCDVAVWIETFPEYNKKEQVRLFLNEKMNDLSDKGRRWQVVSTDLTGWWDLELRVPLEILLGQEDQADWLYTHFQKAFDDLESVGIIKEIQKIV